MTVLGPGCTARSWSADPDVWMLGGVTIFPAGLMAGAAGALRNQIKITVVSTSPLLDRAYPSAILTLCGLLFEVLGHSQLAGVLWELVGILVECPEGLFAQEEGNGPRIKTSSWAL